MMIPPPVSPRGAVYGCIISICRGGRGELYAFKQYRIDESSSPSFDGLLMKEICYVRVFLP